MKPTTPRAGLGTFAGVFTPSLMTMLGLILFLRVGYVVGSTGIVAAVVIVIVAHALAVLTTFSVAGIATNMRVKGGGDYYLISRTLGAEFGGAIGLVLFLAQAVSIGFYCMGFAEAVAAVAGSEDPALVRLWAVAAIGALAVVAWIGVDWATRLQYLVMVLMFAAFVSFGLGAAEAWNPQLLRENLAPPETGLPFWVMFAVFFPAVTGFTQGVSMSGELADPGRSIPRGTFLAIGVAFVVYLGLVLALGAAVSGELLRTDYSVVRNSAYAASVIDVGIFAVTLSSALASFMGAPRILQSLASDRIFPLLSVFAAGSGPSGNPRRAVALSGLIALGVVGIGELNLVASIVSMFFLLSYGLLNYATYYEAQTRSPSFRPTFALYRSRISLVGAIGCFGAILAIDAAIGAIAVATIAVLHQYIRIRDMPPRWADSKRSYHLQRVRTSLLAAAAEPEHPRDWRPQILAFSDDSERRGRMLEFASWIEGGSGLTTVVRIIESSPAEVVEARAEALEALRSELTAGAHTAFPLVIAGSDLDDAIATTIQAAGTGPIRANTVIANWRRNAARHAIALDARQYSRNLLVAFRLGCNLLVLDGNAPEWKLLAETPARKRRIDIWWFPSKAGELMLLLAHLVTRADGWEGAGIRVLVLDTGDEARFERIRQAIADTRIDAEVTAVPVIDEDTLCTTSRDAAIVFIPFSIREGIFYHPFGGRIEAIIERLPITVLTLASRDVVLDAHPDEGGPAAIADAEDARVEAERAIAGLHKEIKKARKHVAELDERIEALRAGKPDPDKAAELATVEQERAAARAQLSESLAAMGPLREARLAATERLKALGILPESDD